MLCPSPRHLPILVADRALSAGTVPGFQAAGVYSPADGGSSGGGETWKKSRISMPNAFSVFDGGGTAEYLAEPAPDAAAT
jgi:hypothetical protein